VSILVPCHNEAQTINQSYLNIKKVMEKLGSEYEILIEEDGSYDGTGEIIKKIADKDKRVKAFSFPDQRKGLGWAWKFLFSKASGDVVIMTDADMSISAEVFPELLKHVSEFDVVIASRYLGSKKELPFKRWLASRIYYALNRLLFGLNVKDSQSGFQVFKKKVLKAVNLETDGFDVNLELLVKAKKKGFSIKEIPAEYEHRADSKFSLLKDGPKTLINTFNLFLKMRGLE